MANVRRLTPREFEIALLIVEGLTYEEMGDRLGISPRTTKAYTDKIRLLLGVEKKRQIPQAMREQGLI